MNTYEVKVNENAISRTTTVKADYFRSIDNLEFFTTTEDKIEAVAVFAHGTWAEVIKV